MTGIFTHLDDDGPNSTVTPVPDIQKLGTLGQPSELDFVIGHSYAAAGLPLSGQNLTAFGAATGQNFAAVFRGHTGAEAVTAGANQIGWLKCTFHVGLYSILGRKYALYVSSRGNYGKIRGKSSAAPPHIAQICDGV